MYDHVFTNVKCQIVISDSVISATSTMCCAHLLLNMFIVQWLTLYLAVDSQA